MANDKKRVKVYELRENDWFDRGTGFCTGQVINVSTFSRLVDAKARTSSLQNSLTSSQEEPRIFVESEDSPDRLLLETRIVKDDGYQKQQDTLIVWTEQNGTDMALSFQEADGCAAIWDFVHQVQTQLLHSQDDALSDDALEPTAISFNLPAPDLGNLDEIEGTIRGANNTTGGREALAKFLIREEYLLKLIPLVETAEDLESLPDLHRLCNIMKALILMNDNSIIEHVVTDDIILGVVGALEYDPDFPTHKANHRQYLSDNSRFKEVVEIRDQNITRRIRHTWRLQYLKDVVLARILDDPTFSVLNSLIFFNQVDIVQHLQNNNLFLKELFAIFDPSNTDIRRKEDAVHFLQQCAAVAKTLQLQARGALLNNFISHGLFSVITFAVKHPSPSMRTTGIDILVALLDHDPHMMRGYMLKAVHEQKTPLTDTLIELLHAETDLGVKNQLADAIKILVDPQTPMNDGMGNRPGSEFMAKLTRPAQITPNQAANEQFAQDHFDRSCRKLFLPLSQLENRDSLKSFTFQEVALHSHLVEILTFFVRQHSLRSRDFVLRNSLPPRVAQLLTAPQKPLKLTALKFFRTCVSLQDQFYTQTIVKGNAFELILNIVIETMPRDNLLNSACLELFEFVYREKITAALFHIVEAHREKIKDIDYVDTFQNIVLRYEQQVADNNNPEMETTLFSQDEETPPIARPYVNGAQRWQGLPEMDSNEEEYFNTSDDEDDSPRPQPPYRDSANEGGQWQRPRLRSEMVNGGASPLAKALVDYPDDDDDEPMEGKAVLTPQSPLTPESEKENRSPIEMKTTPERRLEPSPDIKSAAELQHPLERLSEKRRRQEGDDEDELDKLSTGIKRRNSTASNSSVSTAPSLRKRKGTFLRSKQGPDTIAAKPDSPEPPAPAPAPAEGRKPRASAKIAITLSSVKKDATLAKENAEHKDGEEVTKDES
jgi:protein phosphatase-4 regulatory subunit 3